MPGARSRSWSPGRDAVSHHVVAPRDGGCRQPSILQAAPFRRAMRSSCAPKYMAKAVDRGSFPSGEASAISQGAGAVDAAGRFPLAGGNRQQHEDIQRWDFSFTSAPSGPVVCAAEARPPWGSGNVLGSVSCCRLRRRLLRVEPLCTEVVLRRGRRRGDTLSRHRTGALSACPSKPTRAGPFRRRSAAKLARLFASEVMATQVTRQNLGTFCSVCCFLGAGTDDGSTTTTTSSTAGNGSCSGTVNGKTISGRTMLSLGGVPVERNTGPAGPQSVGCGASSDSIDIVQQNIGTAFGKAECQCHGRLKMPRDPRLAGCVRMVSRSTAHDTSDRTTARPDAAHDDGGAVQQISATNPPDNTIFPSSPRASEWRVPCGHRAARQR